MTDKYLCFSCEKEISNTGKSFIFDVDYSDNPCAENSGHCSEECFYRSTGRTKELRDLLHRKSLRDYFAAKAMQGDWAAQTEDTGYYSPQSSDVILDNAAELYYRMADAMLRAREK
ncbi:hypothetical protein [Morganella psychrotolerans]|uniref:Uncharacterized protein n=1 Tax=Morganella psychrotolerans TaxID=368603 RepID=A0A1B8HR39_9GAMM|nr:hypothetical protein [Morganella psychrotolerans]OBU11731.1 hypothetical protein AYY17_03240 [Morganella psychrotolerans]